MNQIINKLKPLYKETYQKGDLFIDRAGEIYILCCFPDSKGEQYGVFSLDEGDYWDTPCEDISEAIKGLTFLGRDKKITIE